MMQKRRLLSEVCDGIRKVVVKKRLFYEGYSFKCYKCNRQHYFINLGTNSSRCTNPNSKIYNKDIYLVLRSEA